jgi:hypothetical protein
MGRFESLGPCPLKEIIFQNQWGNLPGAVTFSAMKALSRERGREWSANITLTLPIYWVGEGLFDRQNCVLTGTKRSGRLMDASDRDPLAYSTNIQQHQGTSLCRLASALPPKT